MLGNGIYESDYFYDLADTKGILIIQDFMFSQGNYTPTPYFLESVQTEARENIDRLKQHPSLLMWTAGNELNEEKNSELIKSLSEAVFKFDTSRPFVSSLSTADWTDESINKQD